MKDEEEGKIAVALRKLCSASEGKRASAAIRAYALEAAGTSKDLDAELEAVALEDIGQELEAI